MNELFEVAKIISKQKLVKKEQASEKEMVFLKEWLNRSPKNQELYNKLSNLTAEEVWEREGLALDKKSAWDRLAKHAGKAKSPKIVNQQWLRWAAALFIPMVIGIIFFSLNKEKVEKGIAPGSKGAMLTLSSGEKVDLAMMEDLQALEGGKLSQQEGKLIYSEDVPSDEAVLNTVETPIGKEYGLKLSDGSEVYLNPLSKVVFPVSFDQNQRVVKLSGEAYFKVKRDENRPFLVEVDGMTVQVLGTSFSVRSYEGDDFAETVLVEGKVKILDESGVEKALLSPDEKAVLDRGVNSFEVLEVDAKRATAWTEGYYYFEEATLEDIFNDLAKWYEFQIVYERPELKIQRFEGYINKYEELDPVLKIIEHTNHLKIEKNGRTLIVK
ncbi:hypothetical protein GCM10028791_37530 [Echinicola sediminis]